MIHRKSIGYFTFAFCLYLGLISVSRAGQAGKTAISYAAYDGWQSIQDRQLSDDGTWLVYSLVPQDGDGEVVARNLETDVEYRHTRGKVDRPRRRRPGTPAPGKDVVVTADGQYVIFSILPPKSELNEAKKSKKKSKDKPQKGLGILNLMTGAVVTVESVKSFKVPEDTGSFFAYLLEPPKEKPGEESAEKEAEPESEAQQEEEKEGKKDEKKPGSDLVIRQLATGVQSTVPEVVEYQWTKDGAWLAYAVSSKEGADDGAYARRADDGTVRTLLRGEGFYKGLAFDEEGQQLVFVSDRDDHESENAAYKLYHWSQASDSAKEIVAAATPNMPDGWTVSENGEVEFSKNGKSLYFGTAPAPETEPEDAPEPISVDIWHYQDPLLQPMQQVNAEREKKRSYRAVYHLEEKRLVPLATEDMPAIAVVDEGHIALGSSDLAYRQFISWDMEYSDHYLVDLGDGSRRKVIEKTHHDASLSPGGSYALFFDHTDDHWVTVRTSDGVKTDLTSSLGVAFCDELNDRPNEPRPYGIAGWTDGDRSVLLYDRYDIWEMKPDGSGAHMVTRGMGRKNERIYRYQRLDPDEKTIPSNQPILLSTTDDRTKASGYYKVTLSQDADPVEVVMLDKAFGGLIKAKKADRLAFSLETFEEFPDLWVSDGGFAGMKKVSDANPQQASYIWGKPELIHYRNADGKLLRAILTKPEDFDPTKKYPLMVYIYERLTDGLHRYREPAPGTSINITRYVSNGYVVLQPDIVYDIGYPGESSLKCVIPAVNEVVDMGFIDPERIGIQGHSWGGYEITYMITRTDIFAAVQGGASVTNMTSAYGGIRWQSGMSRAFQYERTQSRIGGPPWDNTLEFIENSPLFWVEKVNTPYMTIHNDADGAVPWYQGIEFFSAMRRLGKEAYMFNYNGEEHGLRNRENQKHWTVHMDEFFDYHLKGGPLPEWMAKGVPYIERGKRDLRPLYDPTTTEDRSRK